MNNSYYPVTLNAGYIDINNAANGLALAINAADDAARRIRIGTVDPVYNRALNGVIIKAIGLGNAAKALPADDTFLKRVTNQAPAPNDTGSPIYDINYPAGKSDYFAHSSDISDAFGRIASEILRLSK